MENDFYNLDQCNKIKIGKKEYTIVGYAEFKQGKDFWKKFNIMDVNADIFWLHIYESDEKDMCKIYANLLPLPGEPLRTIYEEQNFELLDEGLAQVIKIRNIKGLSIWDTVYYRDYENAKFSGDLLSYERWNNNLNFEYGKGRYIRKEDITFLRGRKYKKLYSELSSSVDIFYELSLGKKIIINGINYTIYSIDLIERNDTKWYEYKLANFYGFKWLSIEKTDEKYVVSLSKKATVQLSLLGNKEIFVYKKMHELINTSLCNISFHKGQGKFKEEPFIFHEYQTFDAEGILTIKQWKNKRDYLTGKYIKISDIVLTDQQVKKIPAQTSLGMKIFIYFVFMFLGFIILNEVVFSKNLFRYKIEKYTKFSYETMLRSNSFLFEDAYICKSSFNINETFEIIKKFNPKSIKNEWQDNDLYYFTIITNKEIILGSLQKNNDVVIYVSSLKFFNNTKNITKEFIETKKDVINRLENVN